ncbi:MAG: MBOAT family protein [Lachnospiraceae bacterium]|nr:MBOAT family protein [Lachnospiraceae bacterium]
MVFSSAVFLWIFLPLVFAGNLLTGKRLSNLFLLLASLFFYAWGEPLLVVLMIFSVIWNYLAGLLIENCRHKKTVLFLGTAVDLLLLGYYKYAGFLLRSINTVSGASFEVPDIVLPIGISFFTFQAISYIADVYRGRVKASKDPLPVAVYISFFPQLIAGPIVQYADVEKQLRERKMTAEGFALGFRRFIYGLGKKVLIANVLAKCADAVFDHGAAGVGMLPAWIGALAYTFQIYYDFSGYSDMALGLGQMFGFKFPENFNYPYLSKSITEFWRRWHMTLGAWFREYVYIPLGGNRKGKARTYANLWIVFFLTGLWHGADLSFILWGLYHGALSFIERLGFKKVLDKSKVLSRLLCFTAVCIGWVLFRAENTAEGLAMIAAMFTPAEGMKLWELGDMKTAVIAGCAVIGSGVMQALVPAKLKARYRESVLEAFVCAAVLFFCLAALAGAGYNPFIYYQF